MPSSAPTSVEQLEEYLSRPSEQAIEAVGEMDGDLILLGIGGKMGPTLGRMAIRAVQAAGRSHRVIGVSRFSDPAIRSRLDAWGIETIPCDLLDEAAVARLPDAPNVIYMTGMKFGASQNPSLTWAMNCYAPMLVCRRFRDSRIVAFSSGNVYPMVTPESGGSKETDPVDPVGEYSITVLGRERIFEYASDLYQIPVAMLRLNYATEMRYGVLVDIAQAVFDGQPVSIATAYANVIWQADANAMTLAALKHAESPPKNINVAGPDLFRVSDVARRFGELMGKPVTFRGEEAATAYLNDGSYGRELLGGISVSLDTLLEWTVDWVSHQRGSLSKPTHFQVRSGKF